MNILFERKMIKRLNDLVLGTLSDVASQGEVTRAKQILKDEVFKRIDADEFEDCIAIFRSSLRNLKEDTMIFNKALEEFTK